MWILVIDGVVIAAILGISWLLSDWISGDD